MGKKETKRNVTRRSSYILEKHTRRRNSSSRCENSKDGSKSLESKFPVDNRKYTPNLFPRKSIWIVFLLTLSIRISYVSKVENWWILHPDEIFQSVEVAHSEFYGYGFRPYEYMPPLDGVNTTSVGRLQENLIGMYSLRSFLYPKILVMALYVATACGYTGSPMLFWKIFHTAVTSCLPLAVYTFTETLYKSRDVAVLASVLSSTSIFLYVLGTHTLVNSFVSPFFFLALVPLLKLLITNSEKQSQPRTPELRPVTSKSADIFPMKDKSPGEQEVGIESQEPEEVKHHDCNKQQQETMELQPVGKVASHETGNLENVTTKSSDVQENGGIPKTETTNKLYTSPPPSGKRLTNIHKGIIYEIMQHCTKQSRLTAPFHKYEQNTFISGDQKHSTYVENTRLGYDRSDIINDQMDVDFNHNSNDLNKSHYNLSQQRNMINTNRTNTEHADEKSNKNNTVVDRNVLHTSDNNTGGHRLMKSNSDVHHNYNTINKNISEENVYQSTTKESVRKTHSTLVLDGHKMNGKQEHVSIERTDPKVKKEITNNPHSHDCDRDSSGTSPLVGHMMVNLFSGFILSLCIYVRADLLILVALVILPYGKTIYNCKLLTSLPLLLYCTGVLIGFAFGVYDDYCSYGTMVISPWQWLNFNVLRDKSAIFFGKKHWSFYIRALFIQDEVMCVCLIVSCLAFIAVRCKRIRNHEQLMSTNVKLFISLLTFFIIHSLNSHKEVRFLHDFIVLLLIFYASFIVILIKIYKQYISLSSRSQLSNSIVVAFVAYLCSSQWRYFPSPTSGWAFRGLLNTNDVNVCLDYLRQQNDATGVFIDTSIHETGAFSTLHQNVPLIALIHNEFYEFGVDSRLSHKSVLSHVSRTDNLSLSVLTQVSDFVSVYNTPYLLKILINKPVYNYLVLTKDRPFIEVGFREVFRAGDMKILKRSFISEDEVKLQAIGDNIPLGPSCKILDYEANWLLTFGQYDKAIRKLSYCLSLDKTNLQSYQLLMEVRRRQGDVTGARDVYKMCGQYHGHRACTTRPGRIVIHKEYQLNVDM